jgi:hypothetical protein
VLPASGAASFTKTAYAGQAVTFSAKDFESLSTGGALDSIIITSLPAVTDGTLAFAGERILTGSSISANALAGLTFYPAAGLSDSTATFSFVPVYADGSSPSQPLTVNIRMSSAKNSAPVAENITLSTYKNVSLTGEFSAVDPEGDALTFRIMDKPARGSVEIAEDGSNKFVYTPYPNKTGNDIFTYVAVDASGKESAAAKVKISIEKPKTKVNYSDMEDNSANRASIKLAEKGVFIGEQVGASYFFRPDQPVTRSTFCCYGSYGRRNQRLIQRNQDRIRGRCGHPRLGAPVRFYRPEKRCHPWHAERKRSGHLQSERNYHTRGSCRCTQQGSADFRRKQHRRI